MWVCGAVLCCAVPSAFCQALSGSLAAGTGLSANAPLGGNGMASIGPRSEVSASASFTMNVDAKASVDAEDVTGATGATGASAGATRLDFRVGPSSDNSVNGRLDFALERGLSDRRGPGSKRKGPMLSTRANVRRGTMQPEQSRSGQVMRARNGSANKPAPHTGQSEAVYSRDFPDSTKGTALISPFDSTASPLDWTPGMNLGFRDLAEQPFLKPGLHGGSSGQKRRVAARAKAPVTGGVPSNAVTYSDLSTSLGNSLRVRVPDPLADLQSH